MMLKHTVPTFMFVFMSSVLRWTDMLYNYNLVVSQQIIVLHVLYSSLIRWISTLVSFEKRKSYLAIITLGNQSAANFHFILIAYGSQEFLESGKSNHF